MRSEQGERSPGEVATEEADQVRARECTKPATSSGRSKPASRSPNGIASATRIKACAMSNETSRRERQGHRSIAMRLIGVTTMPSTTPSRISSHSPKPTKAEPKRAVMTRIPGTKTLKAPPGGKPGILAMFVRSGPNRSRYSMRSHGDVPYRVCAVAVGMPGPGHCQRCDHQARPGRGRPRGAGTQPGLPGRVGDRVIALLPCPLLEVERG